MRRRDLSLVVTAELFDVRKDIQPGAVSAPTAYQSLRLRSTWCAVQHLALPLSSSSQDYHGETGCAYIFMSVTTKNSS